MRLGVHILPKCPKDSTDRNRTSPFAFTGNKFEFRSLGSSQSISGPNVVLNTIIADQLMRMADELEAAPDFTAAVDALIRKTLKAHMRIIFNGNGYDDAWVAEAKRRGLLNLRTTVDALPYYIAPENIALFERQKVFSAEEVQSRYEMKLENYVKVIDIEALSMIDIARHLILPAAIHYSGDVAGEIRQKNDTMPELGCMAEKDLLTRLSRHTDGLYECIGALEKALDHMDQSSDLLLQAQYTRDRVVPAMEALRAQGDALELLVAKAYWPMPTYHDLMTSEG